MRTVPRPVLSPLPSEVVLTSTQEEEDGELRVATPVRVEKRNGAMRIY
jgi:hypothetical protein